MTTDKGFIPSRHGAHRDQARAMLGIVGWLLPDAEPSEQRWQAMGEALMEGDAPMDELLEWMLTSGMQKTRPLFEQALKQGIQSMGQVPAPLKKFFSIVDQRPHWLDESKITLACQVHDRAGVTGVYIGRDVALIGGYQASAFNRTLLLTGALNKGPTRRFAETLRWALDTTGAGGLQRYGDGFKSTLRVRLIHAIVRRHVRQLPDWQMQDWGLPINQTDMAATLLGALIVPLVGAQVLGMPLTRPERDAVAHHARYTGWLMGVNEEWLPTNNREALVLLYQFLQSITNPDETSRQLAQPLGDEPLHRPYRHLAALRGRYERSKHLSISRAFLGRRGMRNLGLPENVLPWYPAIALPTSLLKHAGSRLLPGGKQRLARRGRAEQEAFLKLMTGEQGVSIGLGANHITRNAA